MPRDVRPAPPFAWLQAARTLACILVVGIHANFFLMDGWDELWPGGQWAFPVFSATVPLFFLVAGLHEGLFTRRTHTGTRALGTRLSKLLAPMYVWTAVMIALHAALGQHFTPGRLVFHAATGYMQLYFLFVLAQCVTVSFIIRRYGGERNEFVSLIAAAGLAIVAYGSWDYINWTGGPEAEYARAMSVTLAPWAVYYFTGVWLGRDPARLRRLSQHLVPLTAVTAVALAAWSIEFAWRPRGEVMAQGHYFLTVLPLDLALVVLLLAALQRFGGVLIKPLAAVAGDTYGVFLSHHLFLLLAVWANNVYGLYFGPGEVGLVWAVALAAAWGFTRAARRLPVRAVRQVITGTGARAR